MSVLIPRLVPRIVSTYQAAITVLVIQGTGSQELQLVMVFIFLEFVLCSTLISVCICRIYPNKELRALWGFFGPPMRLKYKNCFSPICSY